MRPFASVAALLDRLTDSAAATRGVRSAGTHGAPGDRQVIGPG